MENLDRHSFSLNLNSVGNHRTIEGFSYGISHDCTSIMCKWEMYF